MATDRAVTETTETKAEVVSRLLKQGGYVLVVGGGVSSLPQHYHSNPQIILWDDNEQGIVAKSVPSNTRAILYNRWLSHATAGHLREAATALRIPIFPMLTTREIKELLNTLISTAPEVPVEPLGPPIELPPAPEPTPSTGLLMENDVARKVKKGEWPTLLDKHLGQSGPSTEAERLMPLLKKEYGIVATKGAIEQAVFNYRKHGGQGKPQKTQPAMAKVQAEGLDFAEAERLLTEARAAIDLALDFIPKLRKEVSEHRKRTERLRSILGEA